MPGKRPPRQLTRQRERDAWNMRQESKTQAEIAEAIGVSESGVCRMLQRVERRTVEELQEVVEQLKLEQTARLERIFREAMTAWTKGKGEGEDESQVGDVRFLAEARAALKDVRAIWGAEAPTKVAATTPDGKQPYRLQVQNLTDAELELLERITTLQSESITRPLISGPS